MSPIQYPPVYAGMYFLLMTASLSVVNREAFIGTICFYILFFGLVFGTGLLSGWYYREKKTEALKVIGYLIIFSALPFFFAFYYFHGLERAFVILLIWLQAGRNFTLSNRRDLFYAFIITLVLILYGASVSKESFFVFYIIIYILAGMFTLMAANIDERLDSAKGGDKALLTKRMNLPVKGVGLSLAIILLAGGIYFLFPRFPSLHIQGLPFGGGWFYENNEWEDEAKKIKKEINNSDNNSNEILKRELIIKNHNIDEGNKGQNKNDNSVLDKKGRKSISSAVDYPGFRKSFKISKCRNRLSRALIFYLHSDRPIYARGKVFDNFDGQIWYESDHESEIIYSRNSEFTLDKDYSGEGSNQVYTIKRNLPPLIFSAYRPIIVRFPSHMIKKESGLSLRAPEFLHKGTRYAVFSEINTIDGREMGGKGFYIGGYLQLPEIISEKVDKLSSQIVANMQGDYQKARAIESYLKNNFSYTLDTIFMKKGNNIVEDFLEGLKQGHCEYFASTMVIMLRTLGIPARLVTGYRATRKNPFTGYYEVRALDAHAWVEAYIKDYGWVTFEPTPNYHLPDEKKEFFVITSHMRYLEDQIDMIIRKSPEAWWSKMLESLKQFMIKVKIFFLKIIATAVVLISGIISYFLTTGWKLLGVFFLMIGIIFIAYRLLNPIIKKKKMERLKVTDTCNFIIKSYYEMEKLFARQGLPRPLHYTPYEYQIILNEKFGTAHKHIETITQLFHKAKYSPFNTDSKDTDKAYNALNSLQEFATSTGKQQ